MTTNSRSLENRFDLIFRTAPQNGGDLISLLLGELVYFVHAWQTQYPIKILMSYVILTVSDFHKNALIDKEERGRLTQEIQTLYPQVRFLVILGPLTSCHGLCPHKGDLTYVLV